MSKVSSSPIRVAILTVSDTASADPSADKSGPTIRNLLLANPNASFDSRDADSLIVPDDVEQIQRAVRTLCERKDVDWIITTGGTGFGVRDRTPEAIAPLLERHASGLVHLLLSSSLAHTPMAALSRPVAGTIGNTLVVTLPGSVRAVTENLGALLAAGVVGHAVELMRGGQGAGQEVHRALAAQAGTTPQTGTSPQHHHHHHHEHHLHEHGHAIPQARTLSHDPASGVAARNRVSPYPLVSFEHALELIMQELHPLGVETLPVQPALRGHVLAEDVHASQNIPYTLTTNVDGYALYSSQPAGTYRVLTSQTHNRTAALPSDTIFRVNTGGPLPADADAVIMVEDTRVVSEADGEEQAVECLAQVPPGENVRQPGSDVRQGELVLERGDVLSGGEIGTLAFVGQKAVKVIRRPIVAIMSTGNELVDLQKPSSTSDTEWGGIWDTNRPALHASLERLGYEVLDLGIVADDMESHTQVMSDALARADILLTTGGTSMGPTDLLKPVIERRLGGTIHFGRVTVKPGKPTTFATVPCPGADNHTIMKPVFALPGNPASALVTFYVFVVPALRRLGGWAVEKCHLARIPVQLTTPMPLDPRTEFHRVVIHADEHGLKAYSTGGQRSSRVASLNSANGLVVLPMKSADQLILEAGSIATAVLIGDIL